MTNGDLMKTESIVSSARDYLKEPGDKLTVEVKKNKAVVTKLETAERNITHSQYAHKDGSPGKQVLIFKEPV